MNFTDVETWHATSLQSPAGTTLCLKQGTKFSSQITHFFTLNFEANLHLKWVS